MFLKWLPWRFIAGRLAKAHGFLDPIALWARLEKFAQPSQVAAPMELIRAGAALHARGLINTKVIQQNLDWVWPWWVDRQFDPSGASFLPRAFSLTHVNLTHRNWTAVGLPGCNAFPLVDPRGLATPFFDGWSLDSWLIRPDGPDLLPARQRRADQTLLNDPGLAVQTTCSDAEGRLTSLAQVHLVKARPTFRLQLEARSDTPAWIVLALRPFNSEGVSFVSELQLSEDRRGWQVDDKASLRFDTPVEKHATSTYAKGDVYFHFLGQEEETSASCKVGLASAAAGFALRPGEPRTLNVDVDLAGDEKAQPLLPQGKCVSWSDALQGACELETPDETFNSLYRRALRTLVLLSPEDCYPGPYTYRRFWFRDAAFLLHALLRLNLPDRCQRCVESFPRRQRFSGFFHSQAGEWDSNGQVLWLLRTMERITGRPLGPGWQKPVYKAARWIQRKRLHKPDALHDGLLPAGFSAEHLGNNDYYYWDDFWALAGLEAAAEMTRRWGNSDRADAIGSWGVELSEAIEQSLERSRHLRSSPAVPASPYRRMDPGAVGSLACVYPTGLWPGDDPRIAGTLEWLMGHCLVDGLFFQQMIHSGLNAYLTLHLAQVHLDAGRRDRAFELVENVAAAASPTGQWPEAIHPRTGGGCMGDGQHAWAAAEWVLMLHNMFLGERGDRLVLGPGIPASWLRPGQRMSIGPAGTRFGPVRLEIRVDPENVHLQWRGKWHHKAPEIEVDLPGLHRQLDPACGEASLPLRAITPSAERTHAR
jgi:hypothetical protein